MTPRTKAGDLQVATELYDFINREVLPDTGVDAGRFWKGFSSLVTELAPRNAALLAERERLQAELDTWHAANPGPIQDMRAYLFPGHDINGPLPLMPQRRDAWRGGFISQYQGMRELGRYAKYARYGYDMSAVQNDLIEGYMNAATYMSYP